MSKKLKCIDDPENVEKKKTEITNEFKLRALETQEIMVGSDGNVEFNKTNPSENSIKLAQEITAKRFDKLIDCQNIFDKVVEGIEQTVTRKIYYVGKDDNKLFCGPVIQVIPIGTFAKITSGQSTYSPKPPFDDNEFEFEKSRQIMFKVGHRMGDDFVVVVALNGCVVMESDSYGLLNMPVYVVESTGDYYFLNHGNRSLILGPGSHLIVYTKQAPIIFAIIHKTTAVRKTFLSAKSDEQSKDQIEDKEKESIEQIEDKTDTEQTKSNTSEESQAFKQIEDKNEIEIMEVSKVLIVKDISETKDSSELQKSDKKSEQEKSEDSNQLLEKSETKSEPKLEPDMRVKEEPKEELEVEPEKPEEKLEIEPEIVEKTSEPAPPEPVLPVEDHGRPADQSMCLSSAFLIAMICLSLITYLSTRRSN